MVKTVKNIDITKIGPMTYKQLQEANSTEYTNLSPEFMKFSEGVESVTAPSSLFDARLHAEQDIKSPLSDTSTPWGESMFDDATATEEQFQNLGDIRAENQPWYSKVSAGLAKGVVLAGTTFLDGTLGLALGIGTAVKDGRWSGLWDNDFSRAMDEVNKASEELLPNYYTKAEQEEPWYKNVFTANFLGDKFLKNLGFTVGAFYSGGVYSSALKASKLPQFIGAVTKSTNAAKMVTSGVGATLSAINEGRIEALHGADEFEEKYAPLLKEQYENRVASIIQNYGEEEGAYLIEQERENYENTLAKLQEDKAKVGNMILALNIPILTASNWYQFGKLYARGFNTSRRLANITGDVGKYKAADISKLGTALKIAGGALSEGAEEIFQGAAKNIEHHYYATDVNNYYRALTEPNTAKDTLSWTKSFAEGIINTVGEGSSWEEFFIGFLTGALGMPRFRSIRNEQGSLQSPVVLEENAFSKWNDLREQADRNQEVANYLNERINSPEFRNYYQGLIRHNKYQSDMNDAALNDDEFDYKNAEHAQLVSDISMFSNAGKLEDLRTLIDSAFDISDDNIQSIIDNTTTTINKDGKEVKVSPFMDKDGNPMSKEEIVTELTKQRDTIMSTIDDYVKIRKDLDARTGQVFTDEQLDELTWMKSQLGNWSKRASEMSDQIRTSINDVIGRLEGQKRAAEAIRIYEGQRQAELTDEYKRADRIINSIDKAIANLDLLRNLDNENMAATLALNSKTLEGLSIRINKLDDSVLSVDDKKSVLKKLDDLSRLGKASKLFQDKFTEYLTNSLKLEEDNTKVIEENIEEENRINKEEEIEKLNNTVNFQEIQELLNNGSASMDSLNSSNSEAARNYKKASLFKDKATELINTSNSSNKDYLIDMLNRRFNESSTYEDLADEALVTDLPLEATTLDSKEQETIENEFANILKKARDKVDSGSSQKKDVKAEKTGTLKPDNAGKDDVPQPPAPKPLNLSNIIKSIEGLSIPPEVKIEAKSILSSIEENIKKLNKESNVKLLRKLQRDTNSLSVLVGNDIIAPVINKVKELSAPEVFNPGNQNDILNNLDKELGEFKPTEVTGVLKAVIPQFDLDAKRDGVLINFVHGETNKGYSYVYNKLNTIQNINSSENDEVVKKSIEDGLKSTQINYGISGTSVVRLRDGTIDFDGLGPNKTAVKLTEEEQKEAVKILNSGKGRSEIYNLLQGLFNKIRNRVNSEIQADNYSSILDNLVKTDRKRMGLYKENPKGKSAFDYVNEGNVKVGDELEVRYEEATDEHPELLALYHNGTLVNYMNVDESIEGVKEIKDKAKKGEKATVTVTKIMDGKFAYDRTKTQSIGDLLGTDEAVIGVMKNRSMLANTDKFVEPVFDEANSDGKVYLLLPNSKGTLTPKQVYIRHLNKTEYDLDKQDNPIANDLKKVFRELSELSNRDKGYDEALDNIYLDLIDLLYIPDSFHINILQKANEVYLQIAFNDREGKRQNKNILLRKFARKSLLSIGTGPQNSEEVIVSPEELFPQILESFYEANLAFNVNAKSLSGRKGKEYANRLKDSNIISTYLTSKRMQGSWFLLNEKPNVTPTNSSFERAKASQQSKGGTRVNYKGTEYFVRNGIIFDQTGSIVDLGNNSQEVKDLAYISSAYGNSYFGVNQHDGKVLLVDKNGKRGYNRNTNKYMSDTEIAELESILEGRKSKASKAASAIKSLQESQNLVLRDNNGNPDTSNGSYMIKEDDEQYHPYDRVHTVIGSNYIGPKKDNSATTVGSSIDEVSRQFFIDPTNVKKPDDMSDEAFGALKRGLGKFRDDANRRGLKLVTDRTVVFHKYPDGRRVAGELDVFAYNPSTGEISIFDFKTSKYSTKDTAFSKVTRPDMFTRSNKDQYTLQLSAYAKLFEDSFDTPVSNLIIVPFQVRYKDNGIIRINPEDYIPLTYNREVFQRADGKSVNSNKTIKGQYVTMKEGKPEYHQADMQEVFTTGKGNKFYLAKADGKYKLILPNGRAMTIDSALISDEDGRTKANLIDFINSENVTAAIQQALSTNPLENSPYGNSVEVNEVPSTAPKVDDKMAEAFKSLDRLNALKPTVPSVSDSKQESINKREQDKKATVNIDISTPLGRELLSRKKWTEMTEAEKDSIRPIFEGMSDEEIQDYWDSTDAVQREKFIPACF